jgi:hypothetical protein
MTNKPSDPFAGFADLFGSFVDMFDATKWSVTETVSPPSTAPRRMRTAKFELLRLSAFAGITFQEIYELAEAGKLYKLLDAKVKGKSQLRRVTREEVEYLHEHGYNDAVSGLYRRID